MRMRSHTTCSSAMGRRGRAPCCEKIGLNKGSWMPEEDVRLMAYIRKYGHANWRALPKLAGLLRCGKSCRLRWINYLRPDIKRGNFSKEEEDTVIRLHGALGNKWSKIASCLPGRTDNEIKNVWNTHLKKRLPAAPPKDRRPVPAASMDQPSSPSSSIVTDQGENKTEREPNTSKPNTEPSEGPKLDLWEMLDDDDGGDRDRPLPPPEPSKLSRCSSSSDMVVLKDPMEEMPDMSIEPSEIWSIIGDDFEEERRVDVESGGGGGELAERERWLAYLEEELELWGGSAGADANNQEMTGDQVEGGDPVTCYFQRSLSSPPPPPPPSVPLNDLLY